MANNIVASSMTKPGPRPMERGPCRIGGCESRADHPISGLCHMHYMRIRRSGTPDTGKRLRGTGTVTSNGYVAIAKDGKKKQEHVLIVEAVLGRELPAGVEVHHFNEIKSDNSHGNLIVCPSKEYHKLLHARQAALAACGNANHRKCPFCKEYDDPQNMTHSKHGRHYYHAKCKTAYNKLRSGK